MAVYTYDTEADALYVLLVDEDEASIVRTEELAPTLHVDFGDDDRIVGVEFLYPSITPLDPEPVNSRYGLKLKIPFTFAA